MRTVTLALAAVLAICMGWYALQTQDAGSSTHQSETKETAESTHSTMPPILSARRATPAESPGSDRRIAEEAPLGRRVADDLNAEPVAVSALSEQASSADPNGSAVMEGNLPSYLEFAAEPDFTPPLLNGCKHPFHLLAEMTEEPRDEMWAPRMERDLSALLGPHPLGFPVSIGCSETICQITAIGPLVAIRENQAEYSEYWTRFIENVRGASIASEFATRRFFTAPYPDDPNQDISGYVFTTVRQAPASEPSNCAPF